MGLTESAVGAHNLLFYDPNRRKMGEADGRIPRSDSGEGCLFFRFISCLPIDLHTTKRRV